MSVQLRAFVTGIDENSPLEDNCLKNVGSPPPLGLKLHRRKSAFFEAVTSFGKNNNNNNATSPSPLSSHQSSLKSNNLEDACIFEEGSISAHIDRNKQADEEVNLGVLEKQTKFEDEKIENKPEQTNKNQSHDQTLNSEIAEKTKLCHEQKTTKKLVKFHSVGKKEMDVIVNNNSAFLENMNSCEKMMLHTCCTK